jgi:uncharacterized protein
MGSSAGLHHSKLKDFVSWFEIPVWDIHRAARFYNMLYNMEMEVKASGEFAMAYFPADKGIGGALVQGPGCLPGDTGSLIYLNAGNDLDGILARIDLAGGRVIMPKTLINDTAGHFALFLDSEGNRVALHQGSSRAPALGKAKGSGARKGNAKATKAPSRRKH